MPRPKKQIDAEMVDKLAQQGLSSEQVAAVLEVDVRAIQHRARRMVRSAGDRPV